jgi:hypothetical protein
MYNIVLIANKETKVGLGNRLGGLISGIRFANYYKTDLYICWEKTKQINVEFYKLFNNINLDYGKIIFIDEYKNLKNKKKTKWRLNILENEYELLSDDFIYEKDKNMKILDFKYNLIPKQIITSITNCINRIEFNKYINKKVVEIYSKLKKKGKKIIGISIRSWPEREAKKRRLYYNINNYTKILNKYNDDFIFYISGDSDDEIEKLKKLYGSKLIYNKRKSLRMSYSEECIIEDLIDLLVISKTDILVGNKMSSFIELAWFLGGCKNNIDLLEEYK